jgi:hypothetical protein
VDDNTISSIDALEDKEEMDIHERSTVVINSFKPAKHNTTCGIQHHILLTVHNCPRIGVRPKKQAQVENAIVDS